MQIEWTFKQPATVELTHNHGTESDNTAYHSGNSDPKGFGHIGIEGTRDLNLIQALYKPSPMSGDDDIICIYLFVAE